MKKNNLILCTLILVLCISSFSGCANSGGNYVKKYTDGMKYTETVKGTPVENYALTYDFLGGKDVMPIGTYYGPFSSGGTKDGNKKVNFTDEEIIKSFADCGINMVVASDDHWHTGSANTQMRKSINYYNKYKIGYFPTIEWLRAEIGWVGADVPIDEMKLSTKEGVDLLNQQVHDILYDPETNNLNECILGIFGMDEPFTDMIDNFGKLTDVFYNEIEGTQGLNVYGNMLGYWEGENNMHGYSKPLTYEEYLNRMFDEVKMPMFSCTMYPYKSKNTEESALAANMYDGLSVYRKCANHYKVPMWRMLQAGGQWNDSGAWIPSVDPYPSEGETLYDVNLALAYGAKAIQYFPGVQPSWFAYQEGGGYDYNRCGLYGADGNKTQWYYYAQRANEQIKAVDEYLMNAANIGIIINGDKARSAFIEGTTIKKDEIFAENKFRQLTNVSGDDCIIGCFDYKGGTCLYVVNYSRTEKGKVTLKFDRDDYRYTVIQRAKECDVVGGKMELTLDTGEGALVVLR